METTFTLVDSDLADGERYLYIHQQTEGNPSIVSTKLNKNESYILFKTLLADPEFQNVAIDYLETNGFMRRNHDM